MTSPRTHTLRYRIWAYANPRGWDVTVSEIADALDEPMSAVSGAIAATGWTSRLRASKHGSELWSGRQSPHLARIAQEVARDVMNGRISMEVTK